ncbi:MAG TPA: winged helix-turn-helix domain-containing protein [Pseudonocardia sp.]
MRTWRRVTATPQLLTVGPVTLDAARHHALLGGYLVHLPAEETAILAVLMRNPGRVITHDELLRATGRSPTSRKRQDRLARRLSGRLLVNPLLPRLIEPVDLIGYRFTLTPPT